MASTAWARVGAFFLRCGMSAAVSTARTPGSALALLVSMRMILACACGLRRSFASSMPRGLMSATYWTWPVTLSAPSARGMERPTPLTSRVVFMIAMASSLSSGCGGRGLGDGGHHGRVTGAAAEVAGNAVADLVFGGVRILSEQRRGRHEDTRDAESTLRHTLLHERVLERGEHAHLGETLDGADGAAARLHGQHEAARHGLAVDVDGAGSAVAGAAAFLGSGQVQVLAQRIEQRLVGLDEHLDRLVIDHTAQDLLGHVPLPPRISGWRCQRLARWSAVVSVRRVRTRTR